MPPRLAFVATCLALLGFAPAPLPRPHRQATQDPADIAGVWEFVRWERGGRHEPESETAYVLSLKRDSMAFLQKKDESRDAGVYVLTLHPRLSPPAFEMRYGGKGGHAFFGSYRLRGDAMTMVFNSRVDLARRPTDFDGAPELKFELRRIRR